MNMADTASRNTCRFKDTVYNLNEKKIYGVHISSGSADISQEKWEGEQQITVRQHTLSATSLPKLPKSVKVGLAVACNITVINFFETQCTSESSKIAKIKNC